MAFPKPVVCAILVFCCLVLVIAAATIMLSNQPSAHWSMSVISENRSEEYLTDYDTGRVDESFGVGLYHTPNHTPENSMVFQKSIERGEPFSGYLYVNNQMYSANDMLIFCLVDYNQTMFGFELDNASMHHVIHLEPMEEKMYHFIIPPMEEGIHDVEIFLILKPFDHSLNKTFRLKTDNALLGSRRVNVFVGNTSQDAPRKFPLNSGASVSCGQDYVVNDGHLVTLESCGRKAWLTSDSGAGNTLEYSVNAAADTRYPVSVALIPLVDYYQVPFRNSSTENVIFLQLAAGEKISIPAQITIPETSGVHEFMVLWIPRPYSVLDSREKSEQWATSEPSIRVGLNVS